MITQQRIMDNIEKRNETTDPVKFKDILVS